jgi:hypothetical protein
VLGVLDLPAEGAGQVALVERLELDEQRVLVPSPELLPDEVAADANRLPQRDRDGPLTSFGKLN